MRQKKKTTWHRKINLLVAVFLLVFWFIGNLPDIAVSLDRLLFRIRADTASFLFDLHAGPEATPCGELCLQTARQITPNDQALVYPRETVGNPFPSLPLLLPLPSPTTPVNIPQVFLSAVIPANSVVNHPADQLPAAVLPTGSPEAKTALLRMITSSSVPSVPDFQPVDSTPTPSPSTTTHPVRRYINPTGDLEMLFTKYGLLYGVDSDLLKKIAFCESTYNPKSVNHVYGGMYQFLESTWSATRREMGLDPDPFLRFTAEEAIKTAAFKISREGTWAWPVCGKK